jgi:tRNA threonylcarbamoyladenosine biosynthesis protein TsaB
MKLLAFDTSTPACTVAICDNNKLWQQQHAIPMQHGKVLLPIIQTLLNEAILSLEDIDAIIFGAGPGSYTGLRIASSACQALAYATNKPVIRISSLQALAQTAWLQHQCEHVCVIQDARMGQFYIASYHLHDGYMQLEYPESLLTQVEIEQIALASDATFFGVGDGWQSFSTSQINRLLKDSARFDIALTPSAAALIELGKQEYRLGNLITRLL